MKRLTITEEEKNHIRIMLSEQSLKDKFKSLTNKTQPEIKKEEEFKCPEGTITGIGESPDISFAKDIASLNAKSNFMKDQNLNSAVLSDITLVDEALYKLPSGNYKYICCFSKPKVK
jgi:hypothetical protein